MKKYKAIQEWSHCKSRVRNGTRQYPLCQGRRNANMHCITFPSHAMAAAFFSNSMLYSSISFVTLGKNITAKNILVHQTEIENLSPCLK